MIRVIKLEYDLDGELMIPNGFRKLSKDEWVKEFDMWPDVENGIWETSLSWRRGKKDGGSGYIREIET